MVVLFFKLIFTGLYNLYLRDFIESFFRSSFHYDGFDFSEVVLIFHILVFFHFFHLCTTILRFSEF